MKLVLGILCFVLAGVSGFVMKLPTTVVQPKFATAGWLHRQKLVLELFENVCEDSTSPMIMRMADEFSLDNALAKYTLTDLATNFRNLYEGKGLLPKGEIFSEYEQDHIIELQLVYNLLYYANDFDVFYATAAWARQNVNCGIYVDALYAAVLHRRDTEKIALPPPYELLPNYFIRRDVIAKAVILARNHETPVEDTDGVRTVGNVITIDANYTGAFFDNVEESKMAYFTEDVGLNAYYFFANLMNPHWLNRVYDGTNRRGEYWYYIVRQLNARYNLERNTNGFEEVAGVSWNAPIYTEYDPMLMYSNGNFFPERISSVVVKAEDAAFLTDIESRINTLVTQMNAFNKTMILNSFFDLVTSGEKNYEIVARSALNGQTEERIPSVLQHYATALRDPAFWKLNKQMLNMYNVALNALDPYKFDELSFPGVEIMNVEVKKILTYFDYFEMDVTDSVKTNDIDNRIRVNIGQPRLNHKPFSIVVNVSSLVSQKSMVKIYLGPKFMPSQIALKKDSLVLLDAFEYTLKLGTNIIMRKSVDISNLANDFSSLDTLSRKVEMAELGLEPLYFANIDSIVGFPSRLILPKGTPEGIPLQLYVIVAPFVKFQVDGIYAMEFNTEIISPGYPFDRRIDDVKLFNLPNTMFREIVITHKGDNKVVNYGGEGITKKWYYTEPYEPEAAGKSYDYPGKKSYDYTAQQPYETKKFDYKSKQKPVTDVSVTEPVQDLIVPDIPISEENRPKKELKDDSVLPTEENIGYEPVMEYNVIPIHKDIVIPGITNKEIIVKEDNTLPEKIPPSLRSTLPLRKSQISPSVTETNRDVKDIKKTSQNEKNRPVVEMEVEPVHKDIIIPGIVDKEIIVKDNKNLPKVIPLLRKSFVPLRKTKVISDEDDTMINNYDDTAQKKEKKTNMESTVVPIHKEVVVPGFIDKEINVKQNTDVPEFAQLLMKSSSPFQKSKVVSGIVNNEVNVKYEKDIQKKKNMPSYPIRKDVVVSGNIDKEIGVNDDSFMPKIRSNVSFHKDIVVPGIADIIVDGNASGENVEIFNTGVPKEPWVTDSRIEDRILRSAYIKMIGDYLKRLDEVDDDDSREPVYE